jgi:hypothetical protein
MDYDTIKFIMKKVLLIFGTIVIAVALNNCLLAFGIYLCISSIQE